MRCILAVTLLATFASAQQQPTLSGWGQPKDGAVNKASINQPPPSAPKSAWSPSPAPTWERPQQATDYRRQIQLHDPAIFTLAPAVVRSTPGSNMAGSNTVGSNYVPPPALTPLHQPSDDFHSTAGFAVGSVMTREIQLHREKAFVKKFCKSYGSGVGWWYEFENGKRIEGVCE